MKRSLARSLSVLLCLCAAGCVDNSGGKRIGNLVPVTGTVTFDGQTLEKGTVQFFPADPTSACQSAIGEIKDGKFTMMTTISAPGVVAGDYQVRITATDSVQDTPAPGETPVAPDSLIPEKYGNINTSGLEVTISPGDAPLQFELVSE